MHYEINGGKQLFGKIEIGGAKNAILPLLAVSLLTDEPIYIYNAQKLGDVKTMCNILHNMGVGVKWQDRAICVTANKDVDYQVPIELGNKIRASILLLGGLLSRNKRAILPLPGGCAIGARPINLHIEGLQKLGAKFNFSNGLLMCDGSRMSGANVNLPFASVGATENLLIAAVTTRGVTQLSNCAIEPEVEQLARFLVQMGAKIDGIGTSKLTVEGVDFLNGGTVTAIGDRIVASTYMFAVAGVGGEVELNNVDCNHCLAVIDVLKKAGCGFQVTGNGVKISSCGITSLGVVETSPYPGFPTDAQSLLLSACCIAKGESKIVENLFENRLVHNVNQLVKMGAKITLNGNAATVSGGRLYGGSVFAQDLRGGAGLILAGLFAQGTTKVYNVQHVERGYFDVVGGFKSLGADILTK